MDVPVSAQEASIFRSLARGFPAATLAVVDRDMRFLMIDGQLLEHTGNTSASLTGKRICDMFGPEIVNVFVPLYEAGFRGEEINRTLVFGDRVFRHLARPVRDAAGTVTSVVAFTQDISEQVRAEEALRLSERRFRALVEFSSDTMILVDDQRRIIEQGPSAQRVWGWQQSEVVGQDALVFVHPDDHGLVQATFARVLMDPTLSLPTTLRIKHRDGSWRWTEATASNLLSEVAVRAVVVNFHDITPWRHAMESLRVVSESTAATVGVDFLDRLVRGLAEVLGVRHVLVAAMTLGSPPRTLALHGGAALRTGLHDGGTHLRGPVVELVLGGIEVFQPQDALTRYPADALLTTVAAESVIGTPLRSPTGGTIGLMLVLDDKPMRDAGHWSSILRVFALRAAAEIVRLDSEQALRRSEELNRQLLEALPGGLIQVDRSGSITRANAVGASFLGLTWDAASGRYLGDFTERLLQEDGTRCPAPEQPIARVLLSGQAVGPRTMGLRRAEPEGISWGVFSAVPLHDGVNGTLMGGVMCFLDISERKHLEDQLRHSQKMDAIGKLAGGVAHDFNNLLTVILGRSELLLDRLPAEDRTREDIKLFHRTATRAAGLTRQLLSISRQQVTDPRVVDVNHSVTHMADLLRGLIGEHIELRSVLEPRLGRILADPSQIEQVVLNLCVNARDAMPDGGVLTIQTANAEVKQATTELTVGRYVLLVVKDTGSGIDPRIQSRIFEPFFTTKSGNKGTGLGLSTVFGIARQHGGAVSVRSEPGKGSSFFVYLPRSEQPADPSGPQPVLGVEWAGTETILLVEDHDELRVMLEGMLSSRGYRLLTARDGREALSLVESSSETIDLLITDMVMPVMGGKELARQLASRTPPIRRVLYVSGYTDEPMTVERGSQFLQKPFSNDTLARAVHELLES